MGKKNEPVPELEQQEENKTPETSEETKQEETKQEILEEEVYVPKGYSSEDANMLVSINGKNYVLPRGKKVKVPVAVANEIRRAERAQERYEASVAARVEATKESARAAGIK